MTRALQSGLGFLFKGILSCLNAPVVAHRIKAIKAIGALVAVDPDYLIRSDVNKLLQDRISDSSPAVRDAAIDLIGKYIPDKPDVARQYYSSVSSRIADKGVAVRKRVVKLLKVIYGLVEDPSIRIDICCKLVSLVEDEENSVKDLALASLAEIWFGPGRAPDDGSNKSSKDAEVTENGNRTSNGGPHPLVTVIARFRDDLMPVEQTVHQIAKSPTRDMSQDYSRLVGVLLEQLISDVDQTSSVSEAKML